MDKSIIKLAVLFSCSFLTASQNQNGADLIEIQRDRPLVVQPPPPQSVPIRPMEMPSPQQPPPPQSVPIRPMDVVPGQPQPGGPQAPSTPSSSNQLSDEEMERSINEDLQSGEMRAIDRERMDDALDSSGQGRDPLSESDRRNSSLDEEL